MYKERTYRKWVKSEDLVSFEVIEKETDLMISATKNLEAKARESVLNHRKGLEDYVKKDPVFWSSLSPVYVKGEAPDIVKVMASAAERAGVGPMAAVAGAMAEFVGKDLLRFSDEIIVENGGDIFLVTSKKRTLGIYAGERSPFTGNLAIEIEPNDKGLGVSTSSGTVSHSLSFGNADAALIIAEDAPLADAVATATGNRVQSAADIEEGLRFARSIGGVLGVLILAGDKLGSWGEMHLA